MQDLTYKALKTKNAIIAQSDDLSRLVTHDRGYLTLWEKDGHEYLPHSSMKVDNLNLETDELQRTAKEYLEVR